MKKLLILSIGSIALLLSGCGKTDSSGSITPPSTSIPTSESTTSKESTSDSKTSKTSTTSITSTTAPAPETSGIVEAITKALEIKETMGADHEKFSEETVTIKGRVIQDINVHKAMEFLTFLTDGNAMIAVLNPGTGNFHSAIDGYIGKETSNYIIKGKVGYYWGQPCINLESYELKTTMTFDVDYTKFAYSEYLNATDFVNYATTIDYNKKGSGVGYNLASLKGVKCLAKADNNSWIFSDGTSQQGIYFQTSNTFYTIGSYYDIFGFAVTTKWKPSLNTLYATVRTDLTYDVDIPSLAVSKTSAQMYSIGFPDDDTEKSTTTNNVVKSYLKFYKAVDLYFNSYTESSNSYVVASETHYDDEITSKNTASDKKMFKFNNDSYKFQYPNMDYLPVRDYIYTTNKLTTYFVEYQFTKANGRMMPQVYMFENYIPKLSFPDTELKSFFSSQTYLVTEGQVPIIDGLDTYLVISKSPTFIVDGNGCDSTTFETIKTELATNSNIKKIDSESSETHIFYRHNKSNPKFSFEMTFIESSSVLRMEYKHI